MTRWSKGITLVGVGRVQRISGGERGVGDAAGRGEEEIQRERGWVNTREKDKEREEKEERKRERRKSHGKFVAGLLHPSHQTCSTSIYKVASQLL